MFYLVAKPRTSLQRRTCFEPIAGCDWARTAVLLLEAVMIRTDWEGTVGRRRLVANARPRMSMFTSQSLSVLGSRMAMHFERLVNRPLHRYSPFQGSTNLYNPATLPSCRPLYPRPSLSLIDFIPVLPPEPSTVL